MYLLCPSGSSVLWGAPESGTLLLLPRLRCSFARPGKDLAARSSPWRGGPAAGPLSAGGGRVKDLAWAARRPGAS